MIEVWVVERDGTKVARLEGAQVGSLTWDLYGDHRATVAYDPLHPSALSVQLVRREIQIWVDGHLRWWGIPRQQKGNAQQVTMELEPLASALEYRVVWGETLKFISADQIAIGAALVNYAQNTAHHGQESELHIGIGTSPPSGVLYTIDYDHLETPTILELLADFRKADNGYNWDILFTNDGYKFWQPYFPERGVPKDAPLEYGREIVEYEWEQLADICNFAITSGGIPEGEDQVKRQGFGINTQSAVAYGIQTQTMSSGSEVNQTRLNSEAQGLVNRKCWPVSVTSVTTVNDRYNHFDLGIEVGDQIRVTIRQGAIQIAEQSRIRSIEWTEQTTKFTFVNPLEDI